MIEPSYPAHRAPTSSSQHLALEFLRWLLSSPGSQTNIERRGKRHRLRFKKRDPATGRCRRHAVELPNDAVLITAMEQEMHLHRSARKQAMEAAKTARNAERTVAKQLSDLRRRIVAASPRGRVVRERIALVFDLASDLGMDTLRDFLQRKPWQARPRQTGRHGSRL